MKSAVAAGASLDIPIPSKAKAAETACRRLWFDPTLRHSLVECEITTGRTHQIRAHLAAVGYPIVGDAKYGGLTQPHLRQHEDPEPFPLAVAKPGGGAATLAREAAAAGVAAAAAAGAAVAGSTAALSDHFLEDTRVAFDKSKDHGGQLEAMVDRAMAKNGAWCPQCRWMHAIFHGGSASTDAVGGSGGSGGGDCDGADGATVAAMTAQRPVVQRGICLHSWRYTITVPQSSFSSPPPKGAGANKMELRFASEMPRWAAEGNPHM